MQEKNELSDIILDNNKNNDSNKTKKILLLAIILVLIFIVAIVGMKITNKPQEKKNNFNIVLPPEPSGKVESKKEELFKQVPIVEENNTQEKDNFNAMVEKLKNKEQSIKNKAIQQPKKEQAAIAKPTNSAKTTTGDKIVTKKSNSKVTGKKEDTYIQVGVTFKVKPDKNFLKKIKKAGYSYKLYTLKISGKNATKILVGPYKDKKTAYRYLPKVKKEINKAAFVYVIK